MWFFLNLYLQQVLGLSAFPSGSALLPMTVFIMAGMVLVAPRAIARFGPKRALVTGMGVLAVGLGLLALVRPGGSYVVDVLPASLVAAAGMSLAFIPSLGIALSSARPEEGGLAAGIVNTSYQVGSALGLAAMTAVAAANGADQLGDVSSLTNGYSAAFSGPPSLPPPVRSSPPSPCGCRSPCPRRPRRRPRRSRPDRPTARRSPRLAGSCSHERDPASAWPGAALRSRSSRFRPPRVLRPCCRTM